jgi:glycosyltransferase involved in cell wall biosynthesis
MVAVSVVIITKNEGAYLAECLKMATFISNDIIIVDNGSSDDTLTIAAKYGCHIYQTDWTSYGANKNKGAELAKNDWILSIDADEIPDREFIFSIHNLNLSNPAVVYDIKFKSYFGSKLMRFGTWGRDHHIRLFNRTIVKWSEPKVHEILILPRQVKRKKTAGYFHHYSVRDELECRHKAIYYAKLSAEKYYKSGKRSSFVNLYLSPLFAFIKSYILLLGFLDGREGWNISSTTFKNRWLKYHYLNYLENNADKKPVIKSNFAVEY